MNKAVLTICYLVFVASAFADDDAKSWLHIPPEKLTDFDKRVRIDTSDVYEVVASQLEVAIDQGLFAERILKINGTAAKKYAGYNYRCPKGKEPYLVRAVYCNPSTGGFYVYRLEKAIWVAHGSLGSIASLSKSAMIVNLDFEPATAFATASADD